MSLLRFSNTDGMVFAETPRMFRSFPQLSLVILGALLLASPFARAESPRNLRSGDLVFQDSRSDRAVLIRRVSNSPYSHVGIIEVARDGIFVVEAIQPVTRTPWSMWRKRGEGGRVTIMRVKRISPTQVSSVLGRAKAWLGRPYDARYRWDDETLYCSELVSKAFATEGFELGLKQPIRSLQITDADLPLAKKLGVTLDQELVTPGSIAEDADLELVWSSFATP